MLASKTTMAETTTTSAGKAARATFETAIAVTTGPTTAIRAAENVSGMTCADSAVILTAPGFAGVIAFFVDAADGD